MNPTLEIALISGGAAVAGALIGSLAPAVVALLNSRAETRRERMRIATQLALADHHRIMAEAQAADPFGAVEPVAATFVHHLQLLELTAKGSMKLKPQDLQYLREHYAYIRQAVAKGDNPTAP